MNGCDADEIRLTQFAARHVDSPLGRLTRVAGGGNNRLYRLETLTGPLALKAYFHHPRESRDRLKSEYAFVEFAWSHGLRWTPRPIACDAAQRLALYEFVAGRRLRDGQVSARHIGQALQFFTDLNAHRNTPAASALPLGAEACFTLSDHLACVERRVARLTNVEPRSAIDREAATFVSKSLVAAWRQVAQQVQTQATLLGLSLDEPVPPGDRCLSPSDFGFHNALADVDGRMRFLDFEYAGWDDPAKLVCDFFCQVEVPVPLEHWDAVSEAVLATVADRQRHQARFEILLPVYRVKWCCIVLNDFLPVDHQRRKFAQADDPAGGKLRQLAKARCVLEQVAA